LVKEIAKDKISKMPLNKTAKKSWVNFNLNENKIFFDKIKSLYTRKKKNEMFEKQKKIISQ